MFASVVKGNNWNKVFFVGKLLAYNAYRMNYGLKC